MYLKCSLQHTYSSIFLLQLCCKVSLVKIISLLTILLGLFMNMLIFFLNLNVHVVRGLHFSLYILQNE